MFSIRSALPLGAVAALAFGGHAFAQTAVDPTDPNPNGEAPVGFLLKDRDAKEIDARKANADIIPFPPERALRPFFRADKAAHVAGGTALRNRVRGTIQLRGVPLGSTVLRSFLFWNYSDGLSKAPATADVLLDGNLVTGRKTADNSDPCWGQVANHSYVAEVTRYTDQSGGPNQDYEVTLPFPLGTSTSGQHPWAPFEVQDPRVEGATLVVVYQNAATSGPLAVYAPGGDNMFFFSAAYNLLSPGAGPALFTSFGADGQRGSGHNNFASNETSFFNGVQIAGPVVTGSDWDGSDGFPLPQLWDTHTHEVTANAPISLVNYNSLGDCLVPVGFVVDVQ